MLYAAYLASPQVQTGEAALLSRGVHSSLHVHSTNIHSRLPACTLCWVSGARIRETLDPSLASRVMTSDLNSYISDLTVLENSDSVGLGWHPRLHF